MTTILFNAVGDAQLTRNTEFAGLSILYSGAEMRRVTEIHMDSDTRRYFIEWKLRVASEGVEYIQRGAHHNVNHHKLIFASSALTMDWAPKPCVSVHIEDQDAVFTFATYEDAVKYEVSCLDELRRKGVVFA